MREMSNQYKKTKFGLIPNDWEIKKLKNIGNSTIGLTYSPKDVVDEEGILVLRSSNIKDGRLSFQDNVYVKKNVPEKLLLKKGDILVCSRNGSRSLIGKNVLITEDTNYTFGAFMLVFRSKYNEYLYQLFQTNMYQKQIQANLGATINQITTKDLNSFQFPFPKSEKEQKKIISILSTWDKAIELKEKLIEQKKELKKGLMQKLLTGEVRLPGFEEEWEEVKLGELGDFKTSSVDKKVNKNDIEILLVNYMDVYRNRVIDNTIDFMKVTATEKQIETFNVQYGDVLFTPSSETPDDIGHSAVVKVDSAKILYSYHLVRLRFKREMDVDFKAYVFNSSNLLREFSKRATGATRYTLSLSDFKESTIRIPKDITEQKAIGTVLLNSEREIRLLKKELEMLKQQKKGLMQLLLTGKVRVKV